MMGADERVVGRRAGERKVKGIESSRVADRFIRTAPVTRRRIVFSVELPVKLNHVEFRGNNLLFDFEQTV